MALPFQKVRSTEAGGAWFLRSYHAHTRHKTHSCSQLLSSSMEQSSTRQWLGLASTSPGAFEVWTMPGHGAKQSREAEVSAMGTGQPERPLSFKTELSEHQQPDSADQITKAVEGTQRKMTKEDGSRKEGKCRGMWRRTTDEELLCGRRNTEDRVRVLGVKQAEPTRNSSLS